MSAPDHLVETAQCLCLASRRAARTITRAFDRELRSHGLRATQFTLLATLSLKGEQSVSELAEFIVTERTTMMRNISLAEQRGLVSTRRHENDARVRLVKITPSGSEILAAALADWRLVQSRLTAAMGSEAADGLRHVARTGITSAHRSGDSDQPAN